jgi:hypothetical protein
MGQGDRRSGEGDLSQLSGTDHPDLNLPLIGVSTYEIDCHMFAMPMVVYLILR